MQTTISSISEVQHGTDSTAIVHIIDTIRGGRTLDTSGYNAPYIQGGHIIIRHIESGALKPMPVSGTSYSELPEGCEYAGVLVSTVTTADPRASILVHGTVNPNAGPFTISPEVLTALKAQCSHILFLAD